MSRTALATLAAILVSASAATHAQPPRAVAKPVVEDHFGTSISDPYRYFENIKDPDVAKWITGQSTWARQTLDAIPGRDKLLARLVELQDQRPATVQELVEREGGKLFYLKLVPKQNQYKLYFRDGTDGTERVLVDPDALQKQTGMPHAVNYFLPSWDGKYLAYGISAGGSENASLHVMDVASGKDVGEPITRVPANEIPWIPGIGVAWLPDSKSLVYNRRQELKPGMAETETYMDSVVYRIAVGAAESTAQPVFGAPVVTDIGLRRIDNATLNFQPGSDFVVASTNDTTEPDRRLFVLPLKELGKKNAHWVKLADTSDQISEIAIRNNDLYMLTHKGASRFHIQRLDLRTPELAKAVDVVPEQSGVIMSFSLGHDALYADVREPFGIAVHRVPFEGGKPERLQLPVEGLARVYADTAHLRDGAFIYGVSWTDAPRVYVWDSKSGKARDSGIAEAGGLTGFSDVAVERVMVASHDGVKVPLTILHRKDIKLDGNNPAIVYGYGSYGITVDPGFSTGIYTWLEQGGVYAVASVRGGGELGSDWRRDGTGALKPNTWKDGIACAEYLVKEHYSSPGKLSVMGGSAGGIFAGRSMTERPDLFRAAVIQVGATDTLRFETTANGITNVSEFGTVKDPQGFKNLLAMSTLHNIKDGVKYPAVIFVHGINDPRVEVWESLKTGARLQAASTSGRPVVLRLDDKAGHGIGSTVSQRLAETADTYAFLLWQMDIAAYQPKKGG